MGTIDKLWVKLTCPGCGVSETSSALDKGSGWGGSSWGSFGSFESFHVAASGGDKREPEVTSATCKACNASASVETQYGFGRPRGF